MQETDKNTAWHNTGIDLEGFSDLQSYADIINKLIRQQYALDLPFPSTLAEGDLPDPVPLTTDKLLFLLLTYPQFQVRSYLINYIKEILLIKNRDLPDSINCGPVFYPENSQLARKSVVDYPLTNDEAESILNISELILLYYLYTRDSDFLTSECFNILLRVCRFWAIIINNPKNSELWPAEKISREHIQKIASETLRLTIEIIGYLKAESSWLYEDLREQNKFSEIKETTIWKKIIQKASSVSGDLFDITSLKDISKKLGNKKDFPHSMYNQANQYLSGKNESIGDENSLSSVWLNIVFQCFGFSISDKKLRLTPTLPADWKFCRFVFHYRNSMLRLEASSATFKATNLSSNPVDIMVFDNVMRIHGLGEETINLKNI